ncbi:MAG: hypothetical protein JRF33_06415 [Deltaproteobacteria bacterium]|nr:hypothetical protein [Deltaproteobacteria bacterium]
MRIASLFACCLLGALASACAAWLGDIPQIKLNQKRSAEHPVQHAPATLYVEKPEVLDLDEEKDFTPLIEKYSQVLPRRIAEYACARNAFARCMAGLRGPYWEGCSPRSSGSPGPCLSAVAPATTECSGRCIHPPVSSSGNPKWCWATD